MKRKWDPRLDELGVRLDAPDEAEYRLVEARWADPSEANDKHHLYVRVLGRDGAPIEGHPFRIENGGVRIERTKGAGFDQFWGNYPMFGGGSYIVDIPDATTDRLTHMPSGIKGNPFANTCYYLVFQRGADLTQPDTPVEPEPDTPVEPEPEPESEPMTPQLDETTRARLLALLDQAQEEISAARSLLEG